MDPAAAVQSEALRAVQEQFVTGSLQNAQGTSQPHGCQIFAWRGAHSSLWIEKARWQCYMSSSDPWCIEQHNFWWHIKHLQSERAISQMLNINNKFRCYILSSRMLKFNFNKMQKTIKNMHKTDGEWLKIKAFILISICFHALPIIKPEAPIKGHIEVCLATLTDYGYWQ